MPLFRAHDEMRWCSLSHRDGGSPLPSPYIVTWTKRAVYCQYLPVASYLCPWLCFKCMYSQSPLPNQVASSQLGWSYVAAISFLHDSYSPGVQLVYLSRLWRQVALPASISTVYFGQLPCGLQNQYNPTEQPKYSSAVVQQ